MPKSCLDPEIETSRQKNSEDQNLVHWNGTGDPPESWTHSEVFLRFVARTNNHEALSNMIKRNILSEKDEACILLYALQYNSSIEVFTLLQAETQEKKKLLNDLIRNEKSFGFEITALEKLITFPWIKGTFFGEAIKYSAFKMIFVIAKNPGTLNSVNSSPFFNARRTNTSESIFGSISRRFGHVHEEAQKVFAYGLVASIADRNSK